MGYNYSVMKTYYIKRKAEDKLLKLSKSFPAIALTGPRQTGKSTLVKHLFGKTHRYINLDDPFEREKAVSDPRLFIDETEGKVIIDEIQYAPELLHYIKIKIDNERQKKGNFILTGSQQFTMIKNLSESLAGRIALLELLPFSSSEIKDKRNGTILNRFTDGCLKGLFPELIVNKNMLPQEWYAAYINTYLEKDVRSINDIGNLRDYHRFMQLLASRTSQILNMSSLSNDLGVSVNTVKKWISVLEACRIIFLLPPYYENFGKRITKSPKIYFLDCGLVCYLTGIKDKEHLLKGPMAGALFETFCIQEIIKEYLAYGKRPELYYLRTNNELEVDLMIKGNNNLMYPVEIKMTKTPKLKMANSIKKIKDVFNKLRFGEGIILSLSDEKISLTKDVKIKPLNDFIDFLDNQILA